MLAGHYQAKNSYPMGVFIAGRALLQAQSAKRDMGVSGELIYIYICILIIHFGWLVETHQEGLSGSVADTHYTSLACRNRTFVERLVKFC